MERRRGVKRSSTDVVKVVIIDTKHVKIDASSFKSVVQQLTGKDATAESQAMFCAEASRTITSEASTSSDIMVAGESRGCVEESHLRDGMSFKNFDGSRIVKFSHIDEHFSTIPSWSNWDHLL